MLKIIALLLSVAGAATKVLGVNIDGVADSASHLCDQLGRWNKQLLDSVGANVQDDATAQIATDPLRELPAALRGGELAALLSHVPEENIRNRINANYIAGLER